MFFRTSLISAFAIFPSLALSIDGDETAVILAMEKKGRLAQDISRDNRSRPEKVIPLLRLESGDRVADIFGGGGTPPKMTHFT